MTKHTPGKWEVKSAYTGKRFTANWRTITQINGRPVVSAGSYESSKHGTECGVVIREADAHIISAAPELLEACKKAEAFIAAIMGFWGQNLQVANWHQNGALEPLDNFIDDNSDGHTELEDLRAAIAKATKGADPQ